MSRDDAARLLLVVDDGGVRVSGPPTAVVLAALVAREQAHA